MAESHVSPPLRRFTVGGCLSISFVVFRRNFLPFLVLGLLLGLPGLLYSDFGGASAVQARFGKYVGIGSGYFVNTVTNALISATVVYGTFQDLRGNSAGFIAIVRRGTSSILPVLLASLLGALAIYLASLLLFIPGIMLATALWIYIPAIVVERAGVAASFRRSADLTRGYRWGVLGLMLILIAALVIVLMLIRQIVPIDLLSRPLLLLHISWNFQKILIYVSGAIYAVISAVTATVGYYLLRAQKEGVEINEIAKVFD